uniref:Uncharacterized protein n=1 Tax=Ditylenchus dipsaci TaxID=166011 RepID=A0A915CXR2_9BILA
MGLNDSRAKNATFADKSKIDYSRNSESTFRHTSQSNVSKRMIDCAAQGPSKNMEQTYYDENLAASSFKCGDAALDLINKDGEKLRQTQALRLPSQTLLAARLADLDLTNQKQIFRIKQPSIEQ